MVATARELLGWLRKKLDEAPSPLHTTVRVAVATGRWRTAR